jgi:predicted  nucleic acid-binding Zn-ribbon protein
MASGIERVVALWGASKLFQAHHGSGEVDDVQNEEMRRQLEQTQQLRDSHKDAADKANLELSKAYEQIAALKQELARVESASQESHDNTARELESTSAELEKHKALVADHEKNLGELSSKYQDLESRHSDLRDQLDQVQQEHDKKVTDIESLHSTRYEDLENEYNKSLQYFKNTELALTKTRDELNKQKGDNAKLLQQVEDLKLQAAGSPGNDDAEIHDRSASSLGGSPHQSRYNRQYDLQLRDLRAQVIILQEERDELRQNALELKKRAINHEQDLEEYKREIDQLTNENKALIARLHSSGGSDSVDPVTGKSLDTFSNELDQIRDERNRISGRLE